VISGVDLGIAPASLFLSLDPIRNQTVEQLLIRLSSALVNILLLVAEHGPTMFAGIGASWAARTSGRSTLWSLE